MLNSKLCNSTIHLIHIDGENWHDKVNVLNDFGAHLNFIHRGLGQHLELHVNKTRSFQIIVVNGNAMVYQGVYFDVSLLLGSLLVHVNLYVIPNHEANVILGVNWLKDLIR